LREFHQPRFKKHADPTVERLADRGGWPTK
jgi:hypothetical protein